MGRKRKQKASKGKITYSERASLDLAKIMRMNGYDIASDCGFKVDTPNDNIIGILKPKPFSAKTFLERILGHFGTPTYWYIGCLYLKKPWKLEVYGRNYAPELTDLVAKLTEPFNTNVNIKLMEEKPRGGWEYYFDL